MLFVLTILLGFTLQLLIGASAVAVDIEQWTVFPSLIVATWYARKDKAFEALVAAFVLSLTAAMFGGGTRGITLLSVLAGTGVAILLRTPLRRNTWLLRFLHYVFASLASVGMFAILLPLFSVGRGYGTMFWKAAVPSVIATGIIAFPVQLILDRVERALRSDSPDQNLLR